MYTDQRVLQLFGRLSFIFAVCVFLALTAVIVQGPGMQDKPVVWVCGVSLLMTLVAFVFCLGSLAGAMGRNAGAWATLTLVTLPLGVIPAYFIMLYLIVRTEEPDSEP